MGFLKPEQWAEVQRLFDLAADLPAADRAKFLDQECRDPELRCEVVSLLRHCDADSPRALDFSGSLSDALAEIKDPDERLVGTRLGPYRVDAIVGRGGMGAVYRASRADAEFNQLVAIKLVRAAAESRTSLQRFRRERQILARLSHPNIARLLDGGSTPDGIPYLVMEYIEGEPITDWCDRHALDIEARLKLFWQVCRAVEFAHRESVVHRDLKPGNILVTKDGEPKLLDFGIAKILEAGEDGESVTRTGLPVMTPEYAAPEQVLGENISAAADVYVLGLVLYELLTGRKAQEISKLTPAVITRVVCHMEPEPPAAVRRELAGDLDNVIRMAIRKEPARRYATAADLAGDLQRHLEARPISARADTPAYRVSRFIRRNHVVLLWGALAMLLSAALVFLLAMPRPAIPRALQLTQLTQTGRANDVNGVVSDGSEVYFTERSGDSWSLARVSTHGGTPRIMTSTRTLFMPDLQDISPDQTRLLVGAGPPTDDSQQLWVWPVSGGEPWRLDGVRAHSGAWSGDGKNIVFSRGDTVYRAAGDGTQVHKLFQVPGIVSDLRCAPAPLPDMLRFCVSDRTGSHAIWQAALDGTNLHRLLPEWKVGTSPVHDSGTWLAGGRYYLFRTWQQMAASMWIMPERRGLFEAGSAPRQIYSAALEFTAIAPAPDGRRVYFAGGKEHRELLRCDSADHQCRPFREGLAGRSAAFTSGNEWIVYVSFPDGFLWRCRSDGTERTQLLPSSWYVGAPRASADGKWIAFVGVPVERAGRVQTSADSVFALMVMPAAGGEPQILTTGEWEPSWSPDGKRLLFGRVARQGGSPAGLYIIDIATRAIQRLPDSDTTLRAAWSPDGRYAAATDQSGGRILLYNFATRRWTPLTQGVGLSIPLWSHDSRYVYYQDLFGQASEPISRVNIATRRIEFVMGLKQIPQTNVEHYTFAGLTPDDRPIVSVKHTDSDIYSLELELP